MSDEKLMMEYVRLKNERADIARAFHRTYEADNGKKLLDMWRKKCNEVDALGAQLGFASEGQNETELLIE